MHPIIKPSKKPILTVSIHGKPAHEMRIAPTSPFNPTVANAIRLHQQLESDSHFDPTDQESAMKLHQALSLKKEIRIDNFQQSGVGIMEYSGMTISAAAYRAYFLCRPVNPEVANARLLCMLLGVSAITKAMGVPQKSSHELFSGGFLTVKAEQVKKEELTSLAAKYPSLKRTLTSMRELEKSGDFYSIQLDVPLSFIFSLHEQNRIKPLTIEKIDADNWFFKVESNDKKGSIKWRCKIRPEEEKTTTDQRRRLSQSDIYNSIPDWFYTLYIGALKKQPEEAEFEDFASYLHASTEFKKQLTPEAILTAWRDKLRTAPSWFTSLQTEHPDLKLTWNVNQLFNVQALKDGDYTNIYILGRTVNGQKLPVTADYDLFSVIPDRSMSDQEIWQLQQEANVLPEKQITILQRHDGIAVTLKNLSEIMLAAKETDTITGRKVFTQIDNSKCYINRTMYFDDLVELGPVPATGKKLAENDPKIRYKYNAITGFGTLAEGDLTAVFNHMTHHYQNQQEIIKKTAIQNLKDRIIPAELTVAEIPCEPAARETANAGAGAESEPAPPAINIQPNSAHHGPETANPKPEKLPWNLPADVTSPGIFTCDITGDFCLINSKQDLLLFCNNVIKSNKIYGTQHKIPVNELWGDELIAEIKASIGEDNILIHNGAKLLQQIRDVEHREREAARAAALLGTLPEETSDDDHESTCSSARVVNSARSLGLGDGTGSARRGLLPKLSSYEAASDLLAIKQALPSNFTLAKPATTLAPIRSTSSSSSSSSLLAFSPHPRSSHGKTLPPITASASASIATRTTLKPSIVTPSLFSELNADSSTVLYRSVTGKRTLAPLTKTIS